MKRQGGWVQLVAVGLVIGLVAGGLLYVHDMGFDAGYNHRMAQEQDAADEQEAVEAAASESLEQDRETVRTVYRTITKEVERVVEKPVYRDVCLDDPGVRLANAALAGALTPAGEPHSPMPAAGADGRRQGGHGAAEAGGGGPAVPRVPGQAPAPGGGG